MVDGGDWVKLKREVLKVGSKMKTEEESQFPTVIRVQRERERERERKRDGEREKRMRRRTGSNPEIQAIAPGKSLLRRRWEKGMLISVI